MTNETRTLAILGSLLIVTAGSTASAQPGMIAQVPFEFQVGGDTLPRDVYRVARGSDGSHALVLRSHRRAVVVLVQAGRPYRHGEKPQLVFHRVGTQYFLREVLFEGSTGVDLPETRAEREAMERIATSAPAGVQRVVVAAR